MKASDRRSHHDDDDEDGKNHFVDGGGDANGGNGVHWRSCPCQTRHPGGVMKASD